MKRFKLNNEYYKLIDGFEVNESSREVKYSNVKIDFTGKGILDLPLKYQECQLVDADEIIKQASEGETTEGTSINIDYDKDREFEYSLKGQMSQNGTPTPSSPIPIEVVTGEQVVSVCGKNFFDGIFRQGSENSTSVSNYVFSSSNFQLNAGTYTFSTTLDNTYQYAIFGTTIPFPNSSTKTYNSGWKQGNLTFTLSQTLYIGVLIRKVNASNFTPSDIASFNFQIEKGQPTTYEEYKSKTYKINLGKQLIDFSTYTNKTGTSTEFSFENNKLVVRNTTGTYNQVYYDILSLVKNNPGKTMRLDTSKVLMVGNNPRVDLMIINNGTTSYFQLIDRYNVSYNYTIPSDTNNLTRVWLRIISNNSNTSQIGAVELTKPILHFGTQKTSYSPYKEPIFLGEMRNTNNVVIAKDFIRKGTGKNLNDGIVRETFINAGATQCNIYPGNIGTYLELPEGTYTISTTITQTKYRVACINTLPGTSMTTCYNGINKDNSSSNITINTTGYKYLIIDATDVSKIQVEKGNQATLYEPYGYEGQWYIHKEIGRVVLNGSESGLRATTSTSGNYRFAVDIGTNIISGDANLTAPIYSNKFIGINRNQSYFEVQGIAPTDTAYNYKSLVIYCDATKNMTYAQFQTWLASNNVEVCYVLNTPTNTLIEDEELINQLNSIELLEGLNNISITSSNLPFIMNLHYNFNDYIDKIVEKETIYTGYVNNYTLPKMKNKLEYRELDIDLLSPLALATLRTADAVGTYNLKDLIREIIQPLIDDGFTLKELNVGNNQTSVNYLTETIESSLNKLSNKFNFWWYIDKNKNIYINDINYIFSQATKAVYDDNNKINGLIDFTPKMESIDYCNTLDYTNVRLFTLSTLTKVLTSDGISVEYEDYYYNPLIIKDTISPGEEITFDVPFVINTNRRGMSNTQLNIIENYFQLYKIASVSGDVIQLEEVVKLNYDENNNVIVPNNVTISDSFNEDAEFVFVKDSFFDNLIVGFKYNGNSTIQIGDMSSQTGLIWSKVRINDNKEIEINKDIVSKTGIVEKQVDMNEQWLTYEELLDISHSLIRKNDVNVENIEILTDVENDFNVGDIINVNKPSFLTYGDFIITDKKRRYEDNVDSWIFELKNTNILESYIDLFRSSEQEEKSDKIFNLMTGDYSEEGIKETYEVVL